MVCSYFKILFLVCKGLALVSFGIKPCGRRKPAECVCVCVCVCVCERECVYSGVYRSLDEVMCVCVYI